MNTTITIGQAVETIDEALSDFHDGLSAEVIEKITYSTNNNLQVRDYLIGLPKFEDIKTCSEFMTYLSQSVKDEDSYAFNTVNAIYQYELENINKSIELLHKVSLVNEEYSLANLVKRVISAGWPSDSMSEMRNQLADSVIETIQEYWDENI